MATIKLYLGASKKDRVNIRVRVRDGRTVDLYYTSDILINPEYWDEKQQNIKSRISINTTEKTELTRKIQELKRVCEKAYDDLKHSADSLISDNFVRFVERQIYPERYAKSDFFNVYEEFLRIHSDIAWSTQRAFIQNRDNLLRFEKYYQVMKDKRFVLSFNSLTDALLSQYYDFIINEYKYIDHPVLKEFYRNTEERTWLQQRGINTANGRMKKLRTFWHWAVTTRHTDKNPFASYSIPADRYATPIYLTLEERDKIYNLDLSDNDYWDKTRDIFIFQCMIGCRVGDLWKLTKDNVQDDVLIYMPEKTIKVNAKPLIVPLTKMAKEIIAKYKDEDYLIPTAIISQNYYNRSIRHIAKRAGLDRSVVVLNTDGNPEIKPLWQTISSHFARKTFAGNIYKQVKDPALVGSMTGHSANSKAFARYREIDTDIKKEVIKYLEQ